MPSVLIQGVLSRKLRMKVGRMIKRKIGLRRKQGLPR
jgi:hypothetical protein